MLHKLLSLAIIFLSINAHAQQIQQQIINSAGSSISNNGITVAFNVGEPITSTITTNSNMVSQGYIQPINSDLPTSLKAFADLEDNFTLYPNPSVGSLHLNINEGNTKIKRVDIYATDGRLVFSQSATNQVIDISTLSDGIYWLRPVSDEKQFGLKKIVKTH
jgi:hypothetical protein